MNLILKVLLFSGIVSFNPVVFCMETPAKLGINGEAKKDAQELEQESHPAQALIKDEIVKADVLPKVLAPTIAAYAENPYRGYMFIQKEMPANKVSSYLKIPAGKQYILKYKKDFPELGTALNNDSVLVRAHVCSNPKCVLNPEKCMSWANGGCPEIGSSFPCDFSADLLKNKKEDETLYIRLFGILFAITCSQFSHELKFDKQLQLYSFEKAYAKVMEDYQEREVMY